MRSWKKEAFSLCLLAVNLSSKSIPSLTVEPTSSRFRCIVKTNSDIQPHGLNDYWILGPALEGSHCWTSSMTACKHSNKSPPRNLGDKNVENSADNEGLVCQVSEGSEDSIGAFV